MLLSEPPPLQVQTSCKYIPKGGEGAPEPAVEDEEEGCRGQVGHDVRGAQRGHQEERG